MLHMARTETTLINTITNPKLSDVISQIVIALLSNAGRGRTEIGGESVGKMGNGNEMMEATIGALISQNVALKSQGKEKVDPTCVRPRTPRSLHNSLF